MMTVKEAHQNLFNVLVTGRIDMPAGPLTGQEHAIVQQSLQLLYTKAMDAEEDIKEKKDVGADKQVQPKRPAPKSS